LQRPQRLNLHLVDGPLRALEGEWTFDALGEDGCKIALALDFDYVGGLGGTALRFGFQAIANRMVDDFCRVASTVYG
jgi:ribosome-associated toxin RatA of RatAB toxin-antitoxin module